MLADAFILFAPSTLCSFSCLLPPLPLCFHDCLLFLSCLARPLCTWIFFPVLASLHFLFARLLSWIPSTISAPFFLLSRLPLCASAHLVSFLNSCNCWQSGSTNNTDNRSLNRNFPAALGLPEMLYRTETQAICRQWQLRREQFLFLREKGLDFQGVTSAVRMWDEHHEFAVPSPTLAILPLVSHEDKKKESREARSKENKPEYGFLVLLPLI